MPFNPPELLGMMLFHKGKKVRAPIPWKEFMRRVEAAGPAKKGERLPRRIGVKPEGENRCTHIFKAGNRCTRFNMQGGTRCNFHGGYRETPEHPATRRRLHYIRLLDKRMRAKQELRSIPPKDQRMIREALEAQNLQALPEQVSEAYKAYNTNDNGRAWRRYLSTLQKNVGITGG